MNKDFWKFLSRLLLLFVSTFTVCVSLILFSIFVIGPQYQESYCASLIDKVARLEAINEPKIILVGHSGLAFGIKSAMIEEAMNMPVVNLGLHGGLGNVFHENIAKLNINSGDIVVTSNTIFSDDNKIKYTGVAWITIEYHKELWKILRKEDIISMVRSWPFYFLRQLKTFWKGNGNIPNFNSAYSRRAFNEYGDIAFTPRKITDISKVFKPDTLKIPEINDTFINRMNDYNRYIKSKGAVMLAAGFPIGSGDVTPPAEEYDKFQEELVSRLDCEFISDLRDYFIPYEHFYDGFLHLGESGAEIRTKQLIEDLKRWQAKHKNLP